MPLPRVQPIAPIASKVPFDDNAWQFELKYDGFRALCYLEHRRNRFISRTGNILSRFDELADQAASEIVDFDEAILDGEVIAPNETGRPVFLDLLKRACRPAYVVFDLLWLSFRYDLRSWPLRHRLQALEGIFKEGSRVISPPVSVHGRGRCTAIHGPELRPAIRSGDVLVQSPDKGTGQLRKVRWPLAPGRAQVVKPPPPTQF